MVSREFDIYPLLAQGMAPDLHWCLAEVDMGELAATLVAMANSEGGRLFLGVNPQSGKIPGVADIPETTDRIFRACLHTEPTLVIPFPTVRRVAQVDVLEVVVPAGLPHLYSLDGRYYWREGKRSTPIPPRNLRKLLIERGLVLFESLTLPGSTTEDLDTQQVEAYLEKFSAAVKTRLPEELNKAEQILFQRGCLKDQGGELRPTNAAVLLFSRNPQRWLPSANILAARFSGHSFGDRFVKQEINGSLPAQLQQADQFLRANLQSVVRLIGLQHEETLEYPFEAVRELIVNAIAHRDYNLQGDSIHINIFSDRLEVTSPGDLPGPVNLDNLMQARYSRNPVIVQILADMGYVEKLGYGLDRVVSLMRKHSLPPPRFEEVAGSFRVTVYNSAKQEFAFPDMSAYLELDINPRQVSALNYLVNRKRITNREYQELCPEVHPETLRRDLADLVSRGIILKIGDKKSTYYILK
ncbi:MAG: putative DNA binding domain-containing protein [Chloroflexota bacterium]|nr:MAG: putative DNA binding domain-containing protein [Chloroflexota bacterium]